MPIEVTNPASSSSSTDTNLIASLTCDAGVAVGEWVRVDASGVIQQAQADTIANAHVFGVVESKATSTTCTVRVAGISSALFSSLDETTEYFLSPTTAGAMQTTPPGMGSGYVAISLGKPATETKFSVNIGIRSQR